MLSVINVYNEGGSMKGRKCEPVRQKERKQKEWTRVWDAVFNVTNRAYLPEKINFE